ncbi:hypothetical protein HanPI659440_Chr00c03g0709711 [Helianthus annuus]|nr:hypothetical protein HanPI659440_Chr00c03g0709711 [Helianthus annuus]
MTIFVIFRFLILILTLTNQSPPLIKPNHRLSRSIQRPPSRSRQQTQIFPPQFQTPVFLDQRIPSPRKHPQQQTRLRSRVTRQRNRPKPDPAQFLPPFLHFHFTSPLRPTNRHNILYLTSKQLLLHCIPFHILRLNSVADGVEQGGVVMQRLHKPPEKTPAVAQILLDDCYQFRF